MSEPSQVGIRVFALADRDAAGQRSLVVVNAVVGDLQVVGPAVHEDAAAALRAVGDGHAVDARRVALEVARERVAVTGCRSCSDSDSVVPSGNVPPRTRCLFRSGSARPSPGP